MCPATPREAKETYFPYYLVAGVFVFTAAPFVLGGDGVPGLSSYAAHGFLSADRAPGDGVSGGDLASRDGRFLIPDRRRETSLRFFSVVLTTHW